MTDEKAFTLSGITEWLSTKAKTDEDMYYCGAIAGTYLAVERQKAEIERLTKLAELRLRDNQDTCKLLAKKEKQVDELTSFKNEAISMSLYWKGRKDGEEVAAKDTAKKFADLVEFHSVATMEDNVEYFTISALGLKEILHEEFGIPYDEICKEFTES